MNQRHQQQEKNQSSCLTTSPGSNQKFSGLLGLFISSVGGLTILVSEPVVILAFGTVLQATGLQVLGLYLKQLFCSPGEQIYAAYIGTSVLRDSE